MLYSCGFKSGFELKDSGRYTGTCYSLSRSAMIPTQHISFVRDKTGRWAKWNKDYRFSPSSNSKWVLKSDNSYQSLANNLVGRYAFSAALDNQGQLILGGSTNAFDNLGWSFKKYGNLWKSTGNIVKVQNKASISLPNE